MNRKLCSLDNPCRIRAGANGTGSAMKHRTMRRSSATKTMTLDDPREPLSFCCTNYVNKIAGGKDIQSNFLPKLVTIGTAFKLPEDSKKTFVGNFLVTLKRFRELTLTDPAVTKLQCLITIFFQGLFLDYNRWFDLDNSDRHEDALI